MYKGIKVAAEKGKTIHLQKFVSRLQSEFQLTAVKQNSLIVNAVPGEMQVNTDPALLACIIKGLFNTMIGVCQNCCIQVSAKCFNNVVLLRITNNNENTFQNNFDIKEAQAVAESLGGCITLNNQIKKGTAVIFSFINFPLAA
jgi:hypothetical protein